MRSKNSEKTIEAIKTTQQTDINENRLRESRFLFKERGRTRVKQTMVQKTSSLKTDLQREVEQEEMLMSPEPRFFLMTTMYAQQQPKLGARAARATRALGGIGGC